jgi:hypothetical protein
VREADNLTTFMCRMSWKSESLIVLEPSGPQRACYGTALPSPLQRCCDSSNNKFSDGASPLVFTIINQIYITVQSNTTFIIKVKVKVQVTLEQATKAQGRSRGIALLFHLSRR